MCHMDRLNMSTETGKFTCKNKDSFTSNNRNVTKQKKKQLQTSRFYHPKIEIDQQRTYLPHQDLHRFYQPKIGFNFISQRDSSLGQKFSPR